MMIYHQPGEEFWHEGVCYKVGGRIVANEASDYAGLFGNILEIRTEDDRETDNDTPDIYCAFEAPVLSADRLALEQTFSQLYREQKHIEDLGLDMVIMGPEMIVPLEHPRVWIDGQDIFSMPEKKLTVFRRQHIGFIFQSFNLIPELNVEQNITFPLLLDYKKPNQKFVNELLQVLGLSERRKHLPSQLSGGQQQRVAIARALASDPEIIYFDEPTSALDPELTGEVLSVMRQLAEEGMTMLVVTHEMGFARGVSSKTVFMENGVVVEASPSQEFFAHPKEARTREFLQKISHTEV